MAALLLALLLADADAEFLAGRVRELEETYQELASRHGPEAVAGRAAIVRELGHLPFEGEPREAAGRLLARIVAEDRAFRVKARAARAIARVGTPAALAAMIRSLFGPPGREPRFELLHAVLPEALAGMERPDDLEWVAERILRPAAGVGDRELLAAAGPLARDLVALTLEGLGRARASAVAADIAALARGDDPEVRVAALAALAALGVADEALLAAAADPDERVRAAAAASPRLGETAGALLRDASPAVRRAAIRGLARRPDRESVTLLVTWLAHEPHATLRLEVAEALRGLTGKDFGADPQLWRGWWGAARDAYEGPTEPEEGAGRAYFFDVGLRTERVLFVIDVSASMARAGEDGSSRLHLAARELERAIGTLPPGARFRLLMFSSQVRAWPDEPGDRGGGAEAVAALLAQRPGGSTNTYGALMTALEDPFRPDTIVVLTDGTPYRCAYRGKTYAEPEQILAEVRRANATREARIHAVALLSGAPAPGEAEEATAAVDFLRRLAADHRGEFREIR
jgi:HEAT repeat protein